MVQLINKGGFRERANRSRKYQHSENSQTSLIPHRYASAESNGPGNTAEQEETVFKRPEQQKPDEPV